jgi:hypothetical protein
MWCRWSVLLGFNADCSVRLKWYINLDIYFGRWKGQHSIRWHGCRVETMGTGIFHIVNRLFLEKVLFVLWSQWKCPWSGERVDLVVDTSKGNYPECRGRYLCIGKDGYNVCRHWKIAFLQWSAPEVGLHLLPQHHPGFTPAYINLDRIFFGWQS